MIFDCARRCVNIHIDVGFLFIDVQPVYIYELILHIYELLVCTYMCKYTHTCATLLIDVQVLYIHEFSFAHLRTLNVYVGVKIRT